MKSRKRKVYGQLFVKNKNLDIRANLTPSQTLRRAAFYDNRSNGNAVVHTSTTKDFKEVAHGNEAGVVEHVVNAGERWIAYLCIAGVVEPHYGHLLRNFDSQLNKGVEPGKSHEVIGKYNGIGLGAAFDQVSCGLLDLRDVVARFDLLCAAAFHVELKAHPKALKLLAIAGRVVICNECKVLVALGGEKFDSIGHAGLFVRHHAVYVLTVKVSVADCNRRVWKVDHDCVLHAVVLVDRSHEHHRIHAALAQGLDVPGLRVRVRPCVVDDSRVAVLGQLVLNVVHPVRVVCGAHVRNEDAYHLGSLGHETARCIVLHVVVFTQSL